jgi:hypothetical protein
VALRASFGGFVSSEGQVREDTVHVFPVNDLIAHETAGDTCICGPATEPVERDDGSYGWLIVHHSLDGREESEAA